MSDKKKVYVETSVISNLTARPSSSVVEAGRQIATESIMEELWRIKEEIAAQYDSFKEYAADMLRLQAAAHPELATT